MQHTVKHTLDLHLYQQNNVNLKHFGSIVYNALGMVSCDIGKTILNEYKDGSNTHRQ